MHSPLTIGGRFGLTYRPPGRRRPAVRRTFSNGVTHEGLNYLLNAGFRGGQRLSFRIGLIASGAPGSGLDGRRVDYRDTERGHPGWIELDEYYLTGTSIGNGGRVPWVTTDAQGGRLDSRFDARFVVRVSGFVAGAFVSSGVQPFRYAPVIDPHDVLYCTGIMDEDLAIEPGGIIAVHYTLALANED